MNPINQFDKVNLAKLRLAINAALEKVGEEYGIKLSAGNARYAAETASFKLEASVLKNGVAVSREMETLKMFLGLIGLSEEHLEKEFMIGSKTFTLAGYNSRKPKNAMLLRESDTGRSYTTTEDAVRKALGIAHKPQYGAI